MIASAPSPSNGTGYGEWGGHLVVLELDRDKWTQYSDDLGYASGVAEKNGNVYVAWSMSHMMADARLRIHRPDVSVDRAFPALDKHYYQKLAFGIDGQLHAIDREELVKLVDGAPVHVANLGGLPYVQEPMAVGVAPAVVQLLPLDANTFMVGTRASGPLVVRNGAVRKL